MTNAGHKELSGYFAPLSASKYMLLTTFRRDGRAVATPVHVVAEADRAFFRTWDISGKAKRLRHTPMVESRPAALAGAAEGLVCGQGLSSWTVRRPSRRPGCSPTNTPSCMAG